MSKGKIITLSILAVILLAVLSFGLRFGGIYVEGFFSKQQKGIEREVFKESKPFVDGKAQALAKYFSEYQRAETQAQKDTIATIIRMEFADFNADSLDNEALKDFLKKITGYY